MAVKRFTYKGACVVIVTAPPPFAQFVDIYEPDSSYTGFHDQHNSSIYELTTLAKRTIDRKRDEHNSRS